MELKEPHTSTPIFFLFESMNPLHGVESMISEPGLTDPDVIEESITWS